MAETPNSELGIVLLGWSVALNRRGLLGHWEYERDQISCFRGSANSQEMTNTEYCVITESSASKNNSSPVLIALVRDEARQFWCD